MAMALGLTISIASLRVFGDERVVFWRESAPGAGMKLDKLAYFVAKNAVEVPRLALLTFFFVMSFYPIVTPNIEWTYFLAYCFAASFACSGMAYFASISLDPLKAQLLVVRVLKNQFMTVLMRGLWFYYSYSHSAAAMAMTRLR
jgi:hypothetical protein